MKPPIKHEIFCPIHMEDLKACNCRERKVCSVCTENTLDCAIHHMNSQEDFSEHFGQVYAGYRLQRQLDKGKQANEIWWAVSQQPSVYREATVKLYKNADDILEKRIKREVETMFLCGSDLVPKLIAYEERKRTHAIVMEYCPGTNLMKEIANIVIYNIKKRIYIVYQLAIALSQIHRNGYFHRDLNLGNIILDKCKRAVYLRKKKFNFRVRLVDFGLVSDKQEKNGQSTHASAKGQAGATSYWSPEHFHYYILRRKDDSAKIDASSEIFSLGVIWWELFSGTSNWFPIIKNNRRENARDDEVIRDPWKKVETSVIDNNKRSYFDKSRLDSHMKKYYKQIPNKLKKSFVNCFATQKGKRPTALGLAAMLEQWLIR